MFRTMPVLFLMLSQPGFAATEKAATTAAQSFKPAAASAVEFEAVGRPSLLKIKGHGASVEGDLKIEKDKAEGSFEVDLSKLDTGIELRNKHMKENYLKTAEHPKAKLVLDPVTLPVAWAPGKEISAPFKGQLTLKGVTKPVEGKLVVKGEKLETEAEFAIKLSEFDIGVPKYMGVTVADVVNAKVKIPAFERK